MKEPSRCDGVAEAHASAFSVPLLFSPTTVMVVVVLAHTLVARGSRPRAKCTALQQ